MEDKNRKSNLTVVNGIILFALIVVIGAGSWSVGREQGWDKGYEEGVVAGKGVLLDPALETTYELKLVGVSNGKYYQMEGTPLALQVQGGNGPQLTTLPSDVRAGDTLAMFPEGYRKVAKL